MKLIGANVSSATLSGVEYVQANRKLFLGPTGQPDLRDLAGALVVDALCLNAAPIQVAQIDEWFVVAAEQDWIRAETDLSAYEAFHRVQIFHQRRQNSNRANVMITAFAKEVLTVGPEGLTPIKGDQTTLKHAAAMMEQAYPGWRVVAFRGLDP